jgi:hypothetical protein
MFRMVTAKTNTEQRTVKCSLLITKCSVMVLNLPVVHLDKGIQYQHPLLPYLKKNVLCCNVMVYK